MEGESRITWVPVGEVGEVRMGKQLSPASREHGDQLPYLRVANVLEGRIDYSDIKTMSFSQREREIYALRPGDLLLNEGQSLELVGRSAIFDQPAGSYCFQNTLIRYRLGPKVIPKYAQIVFHDWLISGIFAGIAKKTTSIAHLGADRFARLEFPLLPLPEQRRIVEAVGSSSAVETAADRTIAKLRAIRDAMINDIPHRSEECITLSDVLLGPPQNGLYKPEASYGATGTPIIRIDSYSAGGPTLRQELRRVQASSDERTNYGLVDEDILINRVNTIEIVGKSMRVSGLREPTVFESNIMRSKVDRERCRPAFIEAWLSTHVAKSHLRSRAKSAISQASINQHDVLTCPAPDVDLDQQDSFLRKLRELDTRLSAEQAHLVKLRRIKQGLMDDLLSGRVSVADLG